MGGQVLVIHIAVAVRVVRERLHCIEMVNVLWQHILDVAWVEPVMQKVFALHVVGDVGEVFACDQANQLNGKTGDCGSRSD